MFNLKQIENLSIKKKLVLLTVLSSGIILLITSVLFSMNYYKTLYSEREGLLQNITQSTYHTINLYIDKVNNGEMTKEEAQKHVIAMINKIRFLDGRGYFYAYDMDGTCITIATRQELAGKNRIDIKDKNGVYYIKEMVNIAQSSTGSGFLTYQTIKPGEDKNKEFPKVSYVQKIPEWGWLFGTGDYVDDINNQVVSTLVPVLITGLIAMLAIIYLSLAVIGKSITEPIEKITKLSLKLAENDLRIEIENDENQTEIGDLNRSFKKLIDNLKSLIFEVNKSVEDMSSSSQQMNAASDQTAQGAQQVANSVVQLATGAQDQANSANRTLEEITKINNYVSTISESVERTSKISEETKANANEGTKQASIAALKTKELKDTTEEISIVINELGHLGAEIGVIVDLIKNIAAQTNLLALNAAIEAARAGEHGKGFAVVADEVKTLAGQSAQATDKITMMIKEIQAKTENAVVTMGKNSKEVEDSMKIMNNINTVLKQIETASIATTKNVEMVYDEVNKLSNNSQKALEEMETVSSVTEETAAATEEISSIVEEQTASMEEISQGSAALVKIAGHLHSQIAQFRL